MILRVIFDDAESSRSFKFAFEKAICAEDERSRTIMVFIPRGKTDIEVREYLQRFYGRLEYFVVKKQSPPKLDFAFAAFWSHISSERALLREASIDLNAVQAMSRDLGKRRNLLCATCGRFVHARTDI